ncbi:hypothetical protein [Limosilactobacillus oris]|uniref:hypothetical protein n=2 Tax=Limosilactobacillus oris TaxID=1632 RepID=UPI003207B5D7
MGYLTISNNFARQIPIVRPTTGEISLFHALLDLKNFDMMRAHNMGIKKSWADAIDPTSDTLRLYSGLSASGIVKARSKLKQLGFIDFKSRGHRKSTVYKLFDPENNEINNESVDKSNDISSDTSNDNGVDKSNDNSVALNRYRNRTRNRIRNNTSGKSGTSHKKAVRKFAEDSTEMKLALYLFAKIKQNNPEHKSLTDSQKQKWADSIRLMIERDKRTPQQINNMIDWCQADDFWKQNILSTAKLRKQYDTMRPKAKAEWERRGIPPSGSAKVADDPWFNRKKA